jgi:MerR family transcriptional regulator, thiopeptide resistance regulator
MDRKKVKTYTVKQVSELSGVSVRTLHFYDEIGLLKPGRGENGYRSYEKEHLLLLQQILFYRELGFELSLIQKILTDQGFDKIKALQSHRETLQKEQAKTKTLIQTIDKTLAHLQRQEKMKDEEIYKGFDTKKQAEYEKYLIERYGDSAQEKIEESKRRTKNWQKEEYLQVKKDYDEIHQAMTEALKKGMACDDQDVQKIIRRHYGIIDRFWTPNRQAYIGLGQMYCEHADFRQLYDSFHPALAEYMSQAMKAFAEKELS